MKKSAVIKQVIVDLCRGEFFVVCPCCEKLIRLRDCYLFADDDFPPKVREWIDRKSEELKQLKAELKEERRSMPEVSRIVSCAVNSGKILERLAPALLGFPFERNDCRSIFDPIDYVIFEGLSCRGLVDDIVFADIKTGESRLTPRQREIAERVTSGHVGFQTYERKAVKQ
jgi:predicted Holliday junction resolvase-like endonuclease